MLEIRGIGRPSVLGAVVAVVVANGAEVENSAVVGNTEHPKHAQARTKKGSSPEVESGTLYLAPSAAKPTAQTGSSETSMVEQDSSVEKSLCNDKIYPKRNEIVWMSAYMRDGRLGKTTTYDPLACSFNMCTALSRVFSQNPESFTGT